MQGRHENPRVVPGLEAIIRMAETFNVTVDYLLFDNTERCPLNAPSSHVNARLADLDQFTDEEPTTITNVIDALVTKAKLRLITG